MDGLKKFVKRNDFQSVSRYSLYIELKRLRIHSSPTQRSDRPTRNASPSIIIIDYLKREATVPNEASRKSMKRLNTISLDPIGVKTSSHYRNGRACSKRRLPN